MAQNRNIDIWHISSSTVELCTIISNDKFKERCNLYCSVIVKLKDLLTLEDATDYSLISISYNPLRG